MKKSPFLFIALTALLLGFSLLVGLASFVYRSYIADVSSDLTPHLLLSAGIFLGTGALMIFIAGFVALGRRRLNGLESIAWVLLMLIFPVLGALAFFLVSPRPGSFPSLGPVAQSPNYPSA